MKPKLYSTEKIEELVRAIDEDPALPRRFIPHEEVLLELKKQIMNLYTKKNDDAHQITKLLKENGFRTSLKEVRFLIEKIKKNNSKSG